MIPGTKAGGKFTIETIIRDKDGNIKSHTIEEDLVMDIIGVPLDKDGNIKDSSIKRAIREGVTVEAEEKEEGVENKFIKKGETPTAIAEFCIKVDEDISQRLRKEIDKEEKEGRTGIRRIK